MIENEKTNVMRLLDQAAIPYQGYTYPCKEALSGTEVAKLLNKEETCVFKTLVTVGSSGNHFVFVIPVNATLNLKKAAACVKEKKIEMIAQKELLPLTGYVHGGCSPIGMKRSYPTCFDETVLLLDTVTFSAGKIGAQVEVSFSDLAVFGFETADLT